MARWENKEMWDGHGNYLGSGSQPGLVLEWEAHICRKPFACGAFRCPCCLRHVAWCRGASEGPECRECWDARALRETRPVTLSMLLCAALLVIAIVLALPP